VTDAASAVSRPAPFEEDEWPIFFGRERMTDAVVAGLVSRQCIRGSWRLGRRQELADSRRGSCRACDTSRRGAVNAGGHASRCRAEGRSATWRASSLRSTDAAADAEHVLALRRLLNQGKRARTRWPSALLRDDDDRLCILIDQFEELFEFTATAASPSADC
jgi:hypothetical protein